MPKNRNVINYKNAIVAIEIVATQVLTPFKDMHSWYNQIQMITNEEITKKANECLSIFNPSFEIPFPVDRISDIDNDLLVTIADYNDDDVSGFITYDEEEKKYKIFVNSAKRHHRVNFTLAHELGHYFLHKELLL